MDLLLDEEKVMREAVEVVVDEFGADKDLGMYYGSELHRTLATPPLLRSPMVGDGGGASPFVDGAMPPLVQPWARRSFSPAYSDNSGSYGSGFA
jgi:hypothetical protein